MERDYKNIRTSYEKHELYLEDLDSNPLTSFQKWFDFAIEKGVMEPNAFVLSTTNMQNRPSSRVLLVKDVTDEGIVFFSNYASKKGQELQNSPYVSMNFFWGEIERQVRIEGIVSKVSVEESDEYFYSRPKESQFGAMASLQSKPLESRDILDSRLKKMQEAEPKRPKEWGGYLVRPYYFEFWQGRANRLHDRLTFELIDNDWKAQRIYP